jgi:aspartate carbamoyltransferase catalytic subunit
VRVSHDLDSVLADLDVVYLLRMQRERMTEHLVPSLREYTDRFGLTARRVDAMRHDAIVMHPGPMNRGVEISAEVADLPRSVIIDQVRNGVAVRMAVLYLLLGSGVDRVLGSAPLDAEVLLAEPAPEPVAAPEVQGAVRS